MKTMFTNMSGCMDPLTRRKYRKVGAVEVYGFGALKLGTESKSSIQHGKQ